MRSGYIPSGEAGRTCDVCAMLRPKRTLRKIGNTWVCDFHPGYKPLEVAEKAPYFRPAPPKAIVEGKPYSPTDTYAIGAEEIFQLLVTYVPTSAPDAAWALWALCDLVADGDCSEHWETCARAQIKVLGDWLVKNQAAGPFTSGANTDDKWGSYIEATISGDDYAYSETSAVAGIGLLKAHALYSDRGYLTAARACAWFLRSCQCGQYLQTGWSGSLGAKSTHVRHAVNTPTRMVRFSTSPKVYFDHWYYPSGLLALLMWTLFKDAAGDETIGSTYVGSGWDVSRARAVSLCISDLRTFWVSGPPDFSTYTYGPGFCVSTPKDYFYPLTYPARTLQNQWCYADGISQITASSWAKGLRALFEVDGASSQVTTIFDWLMTYTSNAAYELPATTALRVISGYDDNVVYSGTKGTYYPAAALATLLDKSALNNASSLYDLTTVGNLAGLYSTRQGVGFTETKGRLSQRWPWSRSGTQADGQYSWLGTLGACGLSFQPYSDVGKREISVSRAAQVFNVYRYAPQAWATRGTT